MPQGRVVHHVDNKGSVYLFSSVLSLTKQNDNVTNHQPRPCLRPVHQTIFVKAKAPYWRSVICLRNSLKPHYCSNEEEHVENTFLSQHKCLYCLSAHAYHLKHAALNLAVTVRDYIYKETLHRKNRPLKCMG